MKNLRLARKNRQHDELSWTQFRNSEIGKRIRKRYSINDELAILRKRDSKPEEFAEYNAFVENCKKEVDKEMGSG